MKIHLNDFRVPGGKTTRLKEWATDIGPLYKSEKHYKELLAEDVADLSALQRLVYASDGYSLLLIFQAMDAAGKDGAISHVMAWRQPAGLRSLQFQASPCGRIGARLSLAHDVPSAGARPDRDLQPLVIRGRADCPRASRDPAP